MLAYAHGVLTRLWAREKNEGEGPGNASVSGTFASVRVAYQKRVLTCLPTLHHSHAAAMWSYIGRALAFALFLARFIMRVLAGMR